MTKGELEVLMQDNYNEWWRWKQTRLEAQARGIAANIITALQNRENLAWQNYAQSLVAWNAAA